MNKNELMTYFKKLNKAPYFVCVSYQFQYCIFLNSYVCKIIKKVKLPTNYERLKNISFVFEVMQFFVNGSYSYIHYFIYVFL